MLKLKEERYTNVLSPKSRIHVAFKRNQKEVVDFAVNFEIRYKKRWISVVRYDTGHHETGVRKWQFPHKHIYYRKKREVFISMRTRDYNLALSIAIHDIKRNFKRIKDHFFT